MFNIAPSSVNFWFDISNFILVIGAVAVALGTYGAITMGAIKEKFSDERISGNERDTAHAKESAGRANENAAHANHSAELLRESNLNLQKRLVDAERQLESERAERLKIQANIAPREISAAQKAIMLAALAEAPALPKVRLIILGDEEAKTYAIQIGSVLESARVPGGATNVGMMSPPAYGVQLTMKTDDAKAQVLREAFEKANIRVTPHSGDTGEFDATILVGLRPQGPAT